MWGSILKVAIITLRFSYHLKIHRNTAEEEKFAETEEFKLKRESIEESE